MEAREADRPRRRVEADKREPPKKLNGARDVSASSSSHMKLTWSVANLLGHVWSPNIPAKLSQTPRRCGRQRQRQRHLRPSRPSRLRLRLFSTYWHGQTDLITSGTTGMAQRRTNHRTASLPDTAILSRRKLQARRASKSRRRLLSLAEPYLRSDNHSHASGSSPPSSRPVLVPLHFNLRRLPSRIFSDDKDEMRDAGNGYDVSIGMKRKRVVSGSENTSSMRGARSTSRAKRRKAMSDSSEEDHASGMDVDEQGSWDQSDNSDDDGALDSCKHSSLTPRLVLYSLYCS